MCTQNLFNPHSALQFFVRVGCVVAIAIRAPRLCRGFSESRQRNATILARSNLDGALPCVKLEHIIAAMRKFTICNFIARQISSEHSLAVVSKLRSPIVTVVTNYQKHMLSRSPRNLCKRKCQNKRELNFCLARSFLL
jgi:hypothetical protein